MSAPAWYLVTLVVVWSGILIVTFGPGKRARFYAAFPLRRFQELVSLLALSLLMTLSPLAMIAGDRGHTWLYFAPPVGYAVLAGAYAWLGWRARRAGEPTWLQWKHSIPVRPDNG